MPEYQAFDAEIAETEISRFGSAAENLVQVLGALVERFGYVDDEAIRIIADKLNLSRAEVYGVVSFYHDFRREPPGRHLVRVCQAESCQAMGSRELTDHVKAKMNIDFHQTTADGKFSLEPVYCLGNCACSPAVMIDGSVYGRVDPERFDVLIAERDS